MLYNDYVRIQVRPGVVVSDHLAAAGGGRLERMSTQVTNQVELEVARFLAGQPSLEAIIAFRLSPEAEKRIYELIDAEREGNISDEERGELDSYIAIEHLMRLIKAEAHLLQRTQAS